MNTEIKSAIGRRKSSIARIFLQDGKGEIKINKKPLNTYFTTLSILNTVKKPLLLLDLEKNYDININVKGGGFRGQSEAISLAISRALSKLFPEKKIELKKSKLLRRDPRKVERKKYGQKKARKKFQFSKR